MTYRKIMEKYLNTALQPKERALDLLSKMSLDEKMAQVNCLFPYEESWEELASNIDHGIGQVITLKVREIESLKEAAERFRLVRM